jgi:hypothetical protein
MTPHRNARLGTWIVMGRRGFINLFGCLAAVWPLAAHADAPGTRRANQTVTATLPHIEMARVKPVDQPSPTARLNDGSIDLLKDFSLSSSQGIGEAWEIPQYVAPGDAFDERYGRW